VSLRTGTALSISTLMRMRAGFFGSISMLATLPTVTPR
jgi:hypothetical protein